MSTDQEFPIKIGDIFKVQSVIAANIGPAEDAPINQLDTSADRSSYNLASPRNFKKHLRAMAQMLPMANNDILKKGSLSIPIFVVKVAMKPEFSALEEYHPYSLGCRVFDICHG